MNSAFGIALIEETKRRLFEESFPRLRTCLGLIGPEDVWHRVNGECNSVGNLMLHICGNARQWIGSGLGGANDNRNRASEFAASGPMPASELLAHLDETETFLRETLERIDPDTLLQKRRVQIYDESGLSILVHVIEHVSYHTGQITHMVKAMKAVDTGYYAGQKLNQ
ncbi:MAG: hypothetical protein AMXMBFR84_18480 [Candidatus Hydrogenedentota bacterium]